MANRQRGCAAEETQLHSRRNAEGAEMRGLKRQTRDADERSYAVGRRKNAPAAERRSAGLSGRQRTASSIYNKPRTSNFPDRRRIFPLLPTPFASMAQLIVRTPLTAARIFTHSPRNFYSLRTIFPAVIPRSCPFCAQLRLASQPRGRLLVYKESKPVNERSTRSNHLTRLLVYESTRLQGK